MGCAISTIKYILFIFNFFLVLCGALFIGLGIFYHSKAGNFKELLSGHLSFVSFLIIGVGVVLFVIAFFGCCGAIQESNCMMTTYAIFLLTLFFIEVGIGVLAFVYRSNAQDILSRSVDEVYDKYERNADAKRAVDFVQRELRCCGTSGPSSWAGSIPSSCCRDSNRGDKIYTGLSSCPGEGDNTYTTGCIDRLTELSKDSLSALGWVVIIVGSVELVGIVFALCLASSIRRSELRGYA